MAKKKYKDLNVDQKFIQDAIGQKLIKVISLSAFCGLGLWMVLSPDGIGQRSFEKASVRLVKEIWSLPTGIVFMALSLPFIIKSILNVKTMSGFTWVKQPGGHYLYKNKEKISGLNSLSNGIDLVVFNPKENEVYTFVNYRKVGLNKYKKVQSNSEFNCKDTYWIADSDGYSLLHKGLYVSDMTSEYKGEDLIVSSDDVGKSFRFKNYKSNLDNRIRKAERY